MQDLSPARSQSWRFDERLLPRFGRSGEQWPDLVSRVCGALGTGVDFSDYRDLVMSGRLIPAGQILRGAGIPGRVLYNCFVTGAEADEQAPNIAARISRWTEQGAGVGVNVTNWVFQRENPSTSLREIVEQIAVSQEGLWKRGITRTATMVNVAFSCPGLVEIASLIGSNPYFRHVNLGVVVDNGEMNRADCSPGSLASTTLLKIAGVAWANGNPGLVFKDRINTDHPFAECLDACNPCAEQYLAPEEGCNLASLNLSAFVHDGRFDWDDFIATTTLAIRFLDDVIDVSSFPSGASKRLAQSRRRLGLGVTGFATALLDLEIPFGSQESIKLVCELASVMKTTSENESVRLAKIRGPYREHISRHHDQIRKRNSYLFSIAPAGAISLLWGVSSGIEPYFGAVIQKETISSRFHLHASKAAPQTALDITAAQHVESAATWQKFIDGGISKTVNLPNNSSVADVRNVFIDAWRQGCKGITVFREGSREVAVRSLH